MPKINKQFLILFYGLLLFLIFHFRESSDVYTVTAYCNCPICINNHKLLNYKFASNKDTYFGGIAAPSDIPIGTIVTLVPLNRKDRAAIHELLDSRTEYTVEDRGFLIKGRHLDIFIPKRLGGHQTAQKWGTRKMRIAILGPVTK